MSAVFIIMFLGHPMRRILRDVWVICHEDEATPFTSEAEAWIAAHQQCLDPQWTQVRQPR